MCSDQVVVFASTSESNNLPADVFMPRLPGTLKCQVLLWCITGLSLCDHACSMF